MLKRHGYQYVLVDSIYLKPKREMRWEELRYRPYLARYDGAEIIVVPRDRELSNAQLSGLDPGWFQHEVLERTKNRPVYEVAGEDVSVADMMLYLKSVFLAADDDEPVFIMRIFEQQRTRRAMIALFLAVLEMIKMQAIEVCQKDLFGEIALRRQKQFNTVFASTDPVSAIEKDYT